MVESGELSGIALRFRRDRLGVVALEYGLIAAIVTVLLLPSLIAYSATVQHMTSSTTELLLTILDQGQHCVGRF